MKAMVNALIDYNDRFLLGDGKNEREARPSGAAKPVQGMVRGGEQVAVG